MNGRKLTVAGFVCAVVLVASPFVLADEADRVRDARKACLRGDVEKGTEILVDLYVDTKNPNYICNQARCYEQGRRYEDVIGQFQEYLRLGAMLSSSDKDDAEKHIAECRKLLAEEPADAVPSPAKATVAQPQSPAPAPTPTIVQVLSPAKPAPTRGAGMRAAGIVTASVGLAGLLTGLVLNLKVNSMASELKSPGGYSDVKESDRKTYATIGRIGYGVGAGCILAGAVLYYLGWQAGAESSQGMALAPSLGPHRAGIVLGRNF